MRQSARSALCPYTTLFRSGVLVDLRRPTEFAHAHHQCVGKQPTRVHVVDERREAAVELGELLVEALEDLGVMVPAAVIDRHEAHSRLNQPARQQARLTESCAPE